MVLRKGFEPHLVIDDTTITARDIDMLRTIHQSGSMHKAADRLGRSYPHLQRRVVELEEAIGPLTQRIRGGEDGGGTRLTADATALIRKFERLRTELTGVATVPESIIRGSVRSRDGDLVTVQTPAGDILARGPEHDGEVEIAVRADTVVLLNLGSPSQVHTSLRNQLTGTVTAIDKDDSVALVTVQVAPDQTIDSVVTNGSVDRLALTEGSRVVAAFKTTAARATPVSL